MESWQRLVVKPGLNTAMGPLLIIVSIYSISWENLVVTLLFMCVTIPSAIYFMKIFLILWQSFAQLCRKK